MSHFLNRQRSLTTGVGSATIPAAALSSVILYLFSSIPLHFMLDAAKITLFSRNHQAINKKSASYQQITTKLIVNYKLLTVNYKLLFPRRSHPA